MLPSYLGRYLGLYTGGQSLRLEDLGEGRFWVIWHMRKLITLVMSWVAGHEELLKVRVRVQRRGWQIVSSWFVSLLVREEVLLAGLCERKILFRLKIYDRLRQATAKRTG